MLLQGGHILDGSGSPWYRGDVGIIGHRIAAVGHLKNVSAKQRIDVDGCYVAPGFIDMHAHSEMELLSGHLLDAKVLQGVTLEVLGQDGVGLAPVTNDSVDAMAAQFASWSGAGNTLDWEWRTVSDLLYRLDHRDLNTTYLVPHGNLRAATIGWDPREPAPEDMAGMRRMLRDALVDGALGLSTGLNYPPCLFASTAELVALCKVLPETGGYFAPHHRGYGSGALSHYAECIAIAREAHVPVHLTHASLMYEVNRNKGQALLDLVDAARREGLEISLDTYPYTAAAGTLGFFLPRWLHEGGPSVTRRLLQDDSVRERLRRELASQVEATGMPMEWDAVMISGATDERFSTWEGRTLEEIARHAGREPFNCFYELLREEGPGVPCLEFAAYEENVRTIMQHPSHMVGSDGAFEGNVPHPRAWGSFVRYLAHYCRDERILTWGEVIRKMTSLPAQRIGLMDRGLLRPGMIADVVVFDPEDLVERATYADPRATAQGFTYVLVNGIPVVAAGRHTGDTPGRALVKGQDGRSMPITEHRPAVNPKK